MFHTIEVCLHDNKLQIYIRLKAEHHHLAKLPPKKICSKLHKSLLG